MNNSTINTIPFLDLVTPHEELKEELCGAFRAALRGASFIGGPMVEEFEREFAQYCDSQYCVGVANGTDALRFALIASGIQPGDIVVTVPNTFIATTEAISQAGAQPDFVDVEERTYNMDPERLRDYLENDCYFDTATRKTFHRRTRQPVTAIVPVHLYGQMAAMDDILQLANDYNLMVVEDACQAHGAEYFSAKENRWRKAGSMGKAAAFSFYPGKNLGACGEAGAVTTSDQDVAQKIRMLRDHGQAQKYYHDIEGYNGRLDAIQAGFLRIKLRHLAAWNEARRESARRYRELLAAADTAIGLPYEPTWAKLVQKRLAEAGIGTGIHYPIPLHQQKAYRGLFYKEGDFPVVETVAKEILSLPMYPGLLHTQQFEIAEKVLNLVSVIPAHQQGRRAAAAFAD
jgi:dTDP-4-amino-4,6-dideoxygalactose transaminase